MQVFEDFADVFAGAGAEEFHDVITTQQRPFWPRMGIQESVIIPHDLVVQLKVCRRGAGDVEPENLEQFREPGVEVPVAFAFIVHFQEGHRHVVAHEPVDFFAALFGALQSFERLRDQVS